MLATASPSAAQEVRMQALMDPDGYGRLLVNSSGGTWSWEACAPTLTDCTPFGGGEEIKTKGAPPATVFRVKGGGAVGVSPEWRGRLTQVSPPTVRGVVRANDFVSPVPGKWSNGWRDEFSELQLSACKTPAGQDCITLTDPHYVHNCPPGSSLALDARFTGTYLRVADRRLGASPPLGPAFGVTSPHVGEVWESNRSTSVAVVGQIESAVSPSQGECGPPPPAEASISSRGIAFVQCKGGCRAVLVARRGGREARVRRRLGAQEALVAAPPTKLRLPGRAKARIGAGRVRLVLEIDGKPAARRVMNIHHVGG